jgi:O-antigen/teichoic acid export membrane protein
VDAFDSAVPTPTALRRLVGGNVAARVVALVALGIATLLVARIGGPTTVGQYALLRVIPGLVGVVASAGLPTACAYFLARPAAHREAPWAIFGIAVVSGLLATAAWLVALPLLRSLFFRDTSTSLLALAGATVASQLLVATAKSCTQGLGDMRGANRLIMLEEFTFLPPFAVLAPLPISHLTATIVALLVSDLGTAGYGWIVLTRTGFFTASTRPSRATVVHVLSYGARGQVGGVMTLLNLRLDFILLGSFAGPAVVGSYAVASKFAELLRVPSLAINYVLYPCFAREGPAMAAEDVRRMATRALLLMIVLAGLVAACVNPLIPWLYGHDFRAAIVPAYILVAGLVTDGVGAVVSAWLLGCGRPGLNSVSVGAGVVVTVALDVALIPAHHAVGAAVASAAAYLSVTACLVITFVLVQRKQRQARSAVPEVGPALDLLS